LLFDVAMDGLTLAVNGNAMQAVRRVLHRKEYDVAIGRSCARVHDIGRNIDHRTGLGFDGLAADGGVEDAMQNINPLFVGMRMRLGAGPGRQRISPTIMRSPSTQEPFAVE
jgi:hypothetical protein